MSRTSSEKTAGIIQAVSYLLGGYAVTEEATAAAIGARLARLRKDKGITQGEMAEMLGVSQPMVSDYERGRLRLHGELILQISEILKVSADDLLGRTAEPKSDEKLKNRRLYRKLLAIDQLPKRDQEALLRTIDAFLAKTG